MNERAALTRVVAGYYHRTTKRTIHAYVTSEKYLLTRMFPFLDGTSLCAAGKKREPPVNNVKLLSPANDYKRKRGSRLFPTKGVDFVDAVKERQGANICEPCERIVQQQKEDGYAWSHFFLMKKYRIPHHKWADYVNWPEEWLKP